MIKRTSWTLFLIALTCSAGTTADIRRVVTALDATDKAIALFDSRLTLDPGNTGSPSAVLWTTDSAPAGLSFKDDNAAKSLPALPPDAGTALLMVEFPPIDASTEAKMDPNFMMKAIGDRAPARGLPVKHPLMHRTRTVDYAVIVAGEIDMMLDDSITHLKSGDVVVQQATNHAWINRGTEPCRILFVLIDAKSP
jgi:mannose-6-phosphate isomerase-like protein (cupin superfamily)